MKRFVKEIANYWLGALPENAWNIETERAYIAKVVTACDRGLITELEAVYMITKDRGERMV